MALSSKQQQFLDNYVRKHSVKGKGKSKRASAFSLVRQQTIDLLKAEPWLLPQNPAFRTRLDDAEGLGEALKFDRAANAMGLLLADLKQSVQNRPQVADPLKAQAGDPAKRLQLRNQRDAIVNAGDWAALSAGANGGDMKILRARLTPLLDRDPFTAAQLQEASSVIDELTVKRDFLRRRKAEIDKRILQLNKYAVLLQTPSQGYPNIQIQQLAQKAQTLAGKAAATWTRADESEATSLYLDMMLALSERDNVDHKNFKEGQGDEIVLAVRRKYKTDQNAQPLPDEANFKLVVKPMTAEIPVTGFKAGGGAAREMMGSVVGDKLQEMLGIDLNVAKTRLVKVDGDQIGLQGGGQTTASVQAFVKGGVSPDQYAAKYFADRGLKPKFLNEIDEAAVKHVDDNVSKEEVQGKAVFDLIALHADRHRGNFLIDGDNKLVPIDHGNILPTREGLRGRRTEMGAPHAILASTAAAQEKLSPELAERVERLNIDELMAGMKAAHLEMLNTTPDADVGDLDEGMANARRSAEFMKFAARQLTVAQIYESYSKYFEDIFCSAEDDKLAGFARAVAAHAGGATALQTLKQRGTNQEHSDAVWALGWMRYGDDTKLNPHFTSQLLPNHPQRVLDILNQQLRAPVFRPPSGMPQRPEKVAEGIWNQYHAMGGDAAAARLGLLGTKSIAERNKVMALRIAVTGKAP